MCGYAINICTWYGAHGAVSVYFAMVNIVIAEASKVFIPKRGVAIPEILTYCHTQPTAGIAHEWQQHAFVRRYNKRGKAFAINKIRISTKATIVALFWRNTSKRCTCFRSTNTKTGSLECSYIIANTYILLHRQSVHVTVCVYGCSPMPLEW